MQRDDSHRGDAARDAGADPQLRRPSPDGLRSHALTCRVSAAEKAAIAAIAKELGWSQTDVVVAGVDALKRPARFLLSRYERVVLEQLLHQVRGAASNLNTVVRDFHTLRNRQLAGDSIDPASLELALAEVTRQLHDDIVLTCARLLDVRIPRLHLHPTRLAGHVPSTHERLRERRKRVARRGNG